MAKTRLARTQISGLLSPCSLVWALPSFHCKWGSCGWNEVVRPMTYLLSIPSFLEKRNAKFAFKHDHIKQGCYIVKCSKVQACWRAPRSFAVHLHDGWMLITWSRTVSFCRTPTFSARDNGVHLTSSYVMVCFHVVVPCVAPCFICCTLFKPSSQGSD